MIDMVHPITGERIRLTSLPGWAEETGKDVLFMDLN